MKKISILVALAMLVSLLGAFAINASAEESVWDGTYPAADASSKYSGGDGSEAAPYIIASAADLAQLCVNSNDPDVIAATDSFTGVYFKIITDITLNADYANYKSWGDAAPANKWTPMGINLGTNNSYKDGIFKGNINGGGHVIRGLYVEDTSEGWTSAAGFIGYYGGDMEKLGFECCYIKGNASAGNFAGVIAATLGCPNISNCSDLSQCYVKDAVVTSWRGAGLIAGAGGQCNVQDCWASGEVISGRLDGECDSSAFIGWSNGNNAEFTLENCYTIGSINQNANVCGALVGNVSSTVGTITNCYYDSVAAGCDNAIGWCCPQSVDYVETNDIASKDMTVSTLGFSATVWADAEGGTPVLKIFANPEGVESVDTTPATSANDTTEQADDTTAEAVDTTGEAADTTLEADDTTAEPDVTTGEAKDNKDGSNTGLIIGIIAGAVVVIGAVVAIIAAKKKKK